MIIFKEDFDFVYNYIHASGLAPSDTDVDSALDHFIKLYERAG
ncbi:hypothetical protein [Cohnella boryungensis]|uniref:YozE SAM-like domain-containing protein n=1 Tax=Cohnella boryungensis TaxID=768479 RepID=A0ABV8S371_9BACL